MSSVFLSSLSPHFAAITWFSLFSFSFSLIFFATFVRFSFAISSFFRWCLSLPLIRCAISWLSRHLIFLFFHAISFRFSRRRHWLLFALIIAGFRYWYAIFAISLIFFSFLSIIFFVSLIFSFIFIISLHFHIFTPAVIFAISHFSFRFIIDCRFHCYWLSFISFHFRHAFLLQYQPAFTIFFIFDDFRAALLLFDYFVSSMLHFRFRFQPFYCISFSLFIRHFAIIFISYYFSPFSAFIYIRHYHTLSVAFSSAFCYYWRHIIFDFRYCHFRFHWLFRHWYFHLRLLFSPALSPDIFAARYAAIFIRQLSFCLLFSSFRFDIIILFPLH